ncbi:hypothetical protein H6G54_23090 [Anabaena cylindrica FACHB-243]|uniref:Uncharacterized protein n=1 Tax=Anabaena cylindrica (strain ATCC 27899 / PCC 7122) TaxID=272123 RepID=K9ZQM2_ANACC|nr:MULTISPECIES: hypothetical protein [Anabaena]AFZ60842.1 hypothetical protein Anacy_5530 [Anabaena cylindrica PCC 7122]MBD2420536.1 hypothetical protein [Anabaena cylindrica FACHB-243]MBY5281055.1 hypothetical protein [Anabaena sp. CCAP 1446/1C]MBY5309081.1 hypothetical protein [Anabaena sp. CCAP 1446/1C]MCM2406839.1 hypothetical protein [Anabaena sp. CCAP 1446/1C]
MQTKIGKNLLLAILLVFSGGQCCCMGINRSCSAQAETKVNQKHLISNITDLALLEKSQETSELQIIDSETPPNIESLTTEIKPGQREESGKNQQQLSLVQTNNQIDDVSRLSPKLAAQRLNQASIDDMGKTQILSQSLEEQEPSSGEANEEQELILRVRPRPLPEIPPPQDKPADQFQPIGYLRGNVGYFQTSNIFSTNEDQIKDGLIFSGLTLASAYFPIGSNTYLNGSINGSLIRHLDQSQFNYNQVQFNLGLYQEISREMYAEFSLSNQQLFYSNNSDFFAAGDRFLNENSVQLSLGRREKLTDKLTLDSLYELSVNFSDPDRRSRLVNSLWLSLSYYLQKPLQVGLNYQFNLSDYTQRDREDQFHRLFGHLNYRVSNTNSLNLQGGVNFGGSTIPNIDFSGWFFSVNYGFELGRF